MHIDLTLFAGITVGLIFVAQVSRYKARRIPAERKPLFMLATLAALVAAASIAALFAFVLHRAWPLMAALVAMGTWAVGAAFVFGEYGVKHGPWRG